MTQLVQQHFLRAQQKMKVQADKTGLIDNLRWVTWCMSNYNHMYNNLLLTEPIISWHSSISAFSKFYRRLGWWLTNYSYQKAVQSTQFSMSLN